MELSPLLIYFIGQLDAFKGACGLTLVFGGIALVFINLVKAVSYCDAETTYELKAYSKIKFVTDKTNKLLGPIVFVAFLGSTFLPSRSTVAAMIVVPAISANQSIQNISNDALQWAEQYIQEQLNPRKKND
jgi:hypothetical protein